MGNLLGSNGRSNSCDIELQGSATDQNIVIKCDCVEVPETKCLHWAIKERNLEYVSQKGAIRRCYDNKPLHVYLL